MENTALNSSVVSKDYMNDTSHIASTDSSILVTFVERDFSLRRRRNFSAAKVCISIRSSSRVRASIARRSPHVFENFHCVSSADALPTHDTLARASRDADIDSLRTLILSRGITAIIVNFYYNPRLNKY